jgi:cell division protein FtsA
VSGRLSALAGLSGLADVVQSPIHATAVGLALYGARGHGAGGGPTEVDDGTLVGRTGRRLRGWFAELF